MSQTKRFLVYVASNHIGLEVERYEVMRQLVRMGILCCGFPCREDSSPYDWNLAKSQIEDADLFIMILGDEYGPVAPSGISYLHREFVYAQSISRPVLSFVKITEKSTNPNEEQRRLAGFHSVISKESFRLWHLREELISHVKTGVVSALSNKSGGWQKLGQTHTSPVADFSDVKNATQMRANSSVSNSFSAASLPVDSVLDNKQWSLQARQLIRLQFSAKVYAAGNNKLEEVSLSRRWDALFLVAAETMKIPSSEDRLRQAIEALMKAEVTKLLLQHNPAAHAVDDIRLNKKQLQKLLEQWEEFALVSKKTLAGRTTWHLTQEGVSRLSTAKSSVQV